MKKTIEDIERIRKQKRKELDLRVNTSAKTVEKHILVCNGTGCTSSKSPEIVTLIGVVPESYAAGTELSECIAEVFPKVVELTIEYINKYVEEYK